MCHAGNGLKKWALVRQLQAVNAGSAKGVCPHRTSITRGSAGVTTVLGVAGYSFASTGNNTQAMAYCCRWWVAVQRNFCLGVLSPPLPPHDPALLTTLVTRKPGSLQYAYRYACYHHFTTTTGTANISTA